MQSIDTELVTAAVYLFVVPPLYLLVWRRGRHWYVAIAVAALILGFCALLRSETVRAWSPAPRDHVVPVDAPAGSIGLLARHGRNRKLAYARENID